MSDSTKSEDMNSDKVSAEQPTAQKEAVSENTEDKFSASKFFGYTLPRSLVNIFQWLLIIQKLFGVGMFCSLSWFQILIPTWVELLMFLLWPVSPETTPPASK